MASKAKIDLLSAYHPFKKAQRYFMLVMLFNFTLSFIVGLLIFLGNVYINMTFIPTATILKPQLMDLQGLLDLVKTFGLFEIVGMIGMFYFGGGLVDSAKRKPQSQSQSQSEIKEQKESNDQILDYFSN